jgi:hypothetical protein
MEVLVLVLEAALLVAKHRDGFFFPSETNHCLISSLEKKTPLLVISQPKKRQSKLNTTTLVHFLLIVS